MKISLSNGKTFDVEFIGDLIRNGSRVMIELKDDRALSSIASDFEGVDAITKTDSARPNVKEVFEWFTQLVSIQRNMAAGTVRITLEKGDDHA